MADQTDLIIGPRQESLKIGDTQHFVATAVFNDGSTLEVTFDADWESEAPTIVSVDGNGVATGIAVGGPVIVSVTYGGITTNAYVDVTAAAAPPVPAIPAPCALLQKALAQKALLMTGTSAVVIDTPQLGRVEYNRTSIGDLEMWIQQLAAQCAACGGPLPPGYSFRRRRPLSMEACP